MDTLLFRLRRLQVFVRDLGIEGLLCIPGQDGKFNTGSVQAISFLMGRSNRDCVDPQPLPGTLEDSIWLIQPEGLSVYLPNDPPKKRGARDVVKEMREELLGIGANLLSPTAEEVDDPDMAEEAKIAALVSITRGLKTLALPVPATAGSEGDGASAHAVVLQGPALMELERWPLLSAYGLEGVGRPGFFTQNIQIWSVWGPLQGVYNELDSAAVEALAGIAAPTLAQHWNEMTKVLSQRATGGSGGITERAVAEPLLGYFAYGLLRPAAGVSKAVTMPPRVVFGARTNEDGAAPEALSIDAAAAAAGPVGLNHFVAEAADPRSPLRVARTYLITTGLLVKDIFADLDEEAEEGYSFEAATAQWGGNAGAVTLMRVYTALVGAAHAGIAHFTQQADATVHSVRALVLSELAARCEALGVPQPALAQQLRFALWQCDASNHVTGAAVRGSRQLKVLRLSLLDVRSRDHGGALLGGLVYADTFLELPGGGMLNLTAHAVPAFMAFATHGCEAVVLGRALRTLTKITAPGSLAAADMASATAAQLAGRRMRKQQQALKVADQAAAAKKRAAGGPDVRLENEEDLEQDQDQAEGDGNEEEVDEEQEAGDKQLLGGKGQGARALGQLLTLAGGDDAVLLTGCPTSPAIPVQLYCFNNGFVAVSRQTKAMWVLNFHEQLESVTIQELRSEGSATIPEVVVFRGSQPACGLAPVSFMTTNTHIALPLGSLAPTARKQVMGVVLPAWQQACREAGAPGVEGGQPISWVKDPSASSPFPAALHMEQLAAVQAQHEGGKQWGVLAMADEVVDEAVGRVDKALLDSISPVDVSVDALLTRGTTIPPPAGSIPLTLVTGLPGAGQAAVAAVLVSLVGVERGPRVALLPGGCGTGPITLEAAESAIKATCNAGGLLRGAQGGPTGHAILAVSSTTPLASTLHALAATPSFTQGSVYLAGVVSCMNADQIWEDQARGTLVPGLTGQLPPGLLDTVVLTAGSTQALAQAEETVASLTQGSAPCVRGTTNTALMRLHSELLPPAQARAAHLVEHAALRRLGSWVVGGRITGMSMGPLQGLRLSWEGELEVERLKEVLKKWGLGATGAPATPADAHLPLAEPLVASPLETVLPAGSTPSVLGAWGVVRTTLGASAQELFGARGVGTAAATGLRVREWPLLGPALQARVVHGAPQLLASDVACGGELLLLGTRLSGSAVRAAVETCGHALMNGGQQKPLRTRASVTPEEIRQVARERAQDDLPDGIMYNGSRYYDAFGDSTADHPCLPQFIDEFVAEQNARITAENEAIAASTTSSAPTAVRVTDVQGWVLAR